MNISPILIIFSFLRLIIHFSIDKTIKINFYDTDI